MNKFEKAMLQFLVKKLDENYYFAEPKFDEIIGMNLDDKMHLEFGEKWWEFKAKMRQMELGNILWWDW